MTLTGSGRTLSLRTYGFEPCFLLGAIWVSIALATLLAGFVVSAIVDVLLTVVLTRTSGPAASGVPLAGLGVFGVLGRVIMDPALQLYLAPADVIELSFRLV